MRSRGGWPERSGGPGGGASRIRTPPGSRSLSLGAPEARPEGSPPSPEVGEGWALVPSSTALIRPHPPSSAKGGRRGPRKGRGGRWRSVNEGEAARPRSATRGLRNKATMPLIFLRFGGIRRIGCTKHDLAVSIVRGAISFAALLKIGRRRSHATRSARSFVERRGPPQWSPDQGPDCDPAKSGRS
jgi:hypothetical protein